jgi:hypothetical protein
MEKKDIPERSSNCILNCDIIMGIRAWENKSVSLVQKRINSCVSCRGDKAA